jgi:integrase
VQSHIIEYIRWLREKGLSWQTCVIRAAALKHFYEMNDIVLNWKKINRFVGEKMRTVKDRPYTREEIRKMLDKCDERKRVMILLLASTGIRIGALPLLKLRHLTKEVKHDLYQVTVYEGTSSQYVTFCTPECTRAIDEYKEYRIRYGEKLTPESPLIREQFDKNDQFRSVRGKHVARSTLMSTIREIIYDAGLRSHMSSPSPSLQPETEGRATTTTTIAKRKEVMQIHGLRKFYDTATTQAGVHPLYVEMLLGHDIALKGSYFKPTEKDLLEGNGKMLGYLAAIDALTINEENRLKHEVVELRAELNGAAPKDMVEYLSRENQSLKLQMEKVQQEQDAKFERIMSWIGQNPTLALVKPDVLINKHVQQTALTTD